MSKSKKDRRKPSSPVSGVLFALLGAVGGLLAVAVGLAWVGEGVVPQWVRAWEREFKTDDFRFQGWAQRVKVEAPGGTNLIHREGWGWALQAQQDLAPNKTQLIIPQNAVLTSSSILTYPTHNKTITTNSLLIEEECNDDSYLYAQALLVVSLLHENHLGAGSMYREWISTLPKTINNDLNWTPDEMACLPDVSKRARVRRKVSVKRISNIVKKFFKHLDHGEVAWGYSIVASRSWRRGDELAMYPVVDIADQRARHYGKGIWRPLPTNTRIELTPSGSVKVISTKKIKKGDYLSLSPLSELTPSDAASLYGIVDPDYKYILSHLDLSSASPDCTQSNLLVHSNGTATPHTEQCLLLYRDIPQTAPEDVKRATVSKFLTFHANEMLKHWVLPENGPCRAKNLANMPNGPEVLNMITAHVEVFRRVLAVYKRK